VEASTLSVVAPLSHLAAGERRLKKGLWERERTVILMLDEVIITETPPLYSCYGRYGQQVCVPITGNRAKRILHGAINSVSGDVLFLITAEWIAESHQAFLRMVRVHWRGWHLILFEDRGTPHTAEESLELAKRLGIEIRLLPRATPELNAMDHLWRSVKGRGVANRSTISIDDSADKACNHIFRMSCHERRKKAGILSEDFWLAP
jgi:transposase